MKLLLFYMPSFQYKTHARSLPDAPEVDEEKEVTQCVVALVQAEEDDPDKGKKVLDKLLKNVKWLCGKFATKKVVLHSFNHLSGSKAKPDFSKEILDEVVTRLERTDYQVLVTPFGYFNEFDIHVAGDSLAKVFKEF